MTTTTDLLSVELELDSVRTTRDAWGIARAYVRGGDLPQGRSITITGILPTQQPGTHFACQVRYSDHPRYGPQYLLVGTQAPAGSVSHNDTGDPSVPIQMTLTIDAILLTKEDTGWIKAWAGVVAGPLTLIGRTIKVNGVLPNLYPGCAIEVSATFDPKWGDYKIATALPRLPFTEAGMRQYLQGAFKDVGPKRTAAIWDAFGMHTAAVLDGADAVDRLAAKPPAGAGIAPGWGVKIVAQWRDQAAEREVTLVLSSAGLSLSKCHKVSRYFGQSTPAILRENPYRLMEVDGIGFRIADSVGQRMGMAASDPRRLEAGLAEVAQQAAARQGDCYLPIDIAVQDASNLLDQPGDRILAQALTVDQEGDSPRLIAVEPERDRLWSAPLLTAEQTVAEGIHRLLHAPLAATVDMGDAHWADVFAAQTNATGQAITPSAEQQAAVRFLTGDTAPVGILRGGPGVGKSQTLRTILDTFNAAGISNIALCAPTGKAARRMRELTGRPASTIHSLLGGAEGQVDAVVVVVDEASMVDVLLMAWLVESIQTGTRLLLIGDTNQLPSVGPGKVLTDLIAAGVPCIELTQIFRQAAESAIIQTAYHIIGGAVPRLTPALGAHLNAADPDAIWCDAPTAPAIARQVVSLVRDLIPAAYGIAPADVRVLVPVYKTECGIHMLNSALQAALNPPRPDMPDIPWGDVPVAEDKRLKRVLRCGDRLLWLSNDKALQLVNGSEVEVTGITTLDNGTHQIALRCTDDDTVPPLLLRLMEIDAIHAYAMSVHKSQGSEYPAVVMVAHAAHAFTRRRLLYTGVTRAKRRLVVLGTLDALTAAIGRCTEDGRRTALVERLQTMRDLAQVGT